MSTYLFLGGPLDGQYHEVEDPPPEVVPYISEMPFRSVSEYQPQVLSYFLQPETLYALESAPSDWSLPEPAEELPLLPRIHRGAWDDSFPIAPTLRSNRLVLDED